MAQPFRGIEAVLFDLDGTLIDSAPDLAAAADRLRTDRGLPPIPLDTYRPMAGAGARGLLGVAFGIAPDHPDFADLREAFFQNYERAMTVRTTLFPGVPELVDALLQRGLRWGVVTNKSERFTLPLVRQLPLFASASVVICGDTTPHTKPHPAPLLEAMNRMSIGRQACLYVGDDERDMVAGRAAGMRTVAACYGYLGASHDVAAWQADARIDHALQMLDWLAHG